MRRFGVGLLLLVVTVTVLSVSQVEAAAQYHTVVVGDTLWKIAVKYEVGLSELIAANPQLENPNLIYPGDRIAIPDLSEVKSLEMQVVELVNQERAKQGLKPLKYNWELARVARYKSMDMRDNGYFSHTSPTYGSPFKMMRDFGIRYTRAGENIAYGYLTPESVMRGWMNSSGHRKNILSPNYTEIGVGVAKSSSGRIYWTQMFITR